MSSTLPPSYRRTSSGVIQFTNTDLNERRNSLEDSEERSKIQYDVSMYMLWDSIRNLNESGSKITVKNKESWFQNTLYWCTKSGKVDVLNWLLNHGININIKYKNGEIALHKASKYKHPYIVKMLLSAGSNINAQDKYGETPLHYAAMYGQLENLFHILAYGANVNIVNNNKETILHKVMLKGSDADTNITILDCLIQKGINVNSVDKNGENVLHIAARTRKFQEYEYLIQSRVRINVKNIYGETPLNVKNLVENRWDIRDSLNKQVRQLRKAKTMPVFNLK